VSRNKLLALLVCANVVLLAGLILRSTSLPSALAQGTGLAGNYVVVAGEVRDQFDALYLLDLRTRVLTCYLFDRTSKRLTPTDSRDLERDFRNNRENP
jgi:hypothetical protein